MSEPSTTNLYDRAQLILSEKRTSLSMLRTGLSIFILPLSVLSILIATSKAYSFDSVLPFMIPLMILLVALVGLASYLVIRSVMRLHHCDNLLRKMRQQSPEFSDIID